MAEEGQKKVDEEVDFESAEESREQNLEVMGEEDFESGYIPHPKVGEEIEIDVLKTYKDKNVRAKTKEGKAFSSALSSVDYKFTVELSNGKKYSPSAWEVWGKIRAILKQRIKDGKFDKDKKEFNPPVKLRIKHAEDGFKKTKSKDAKPNYEVEEIVS